MSVILRDTPHVLSAIILDIEIVLFVKMVVLNVSFVMKDTLLLMMRLRFVLHAKGTILKLAHHVKDTIGKFVLYAMG